MSGHRSDAQRPSGPQQGSDPRGASVPQRSSGPRRRDFLRYSGGAAAAGGLAGAGLLAQSGTAAAAQSPAQAAQGTVAATGTLAAAPIRPPAAPLAVRNPYLSTWLPATALPGTWEQFWQGHVTAMAGIARIDGTAYMFMGAPSITLTVPDGNHGTPSTVSGFERALQQTGLTVTPTRSVFTLEGGEWESPSSSSARWSRATGAASRSR